MKHTHTKTKYIHLFHPKKLHSHVKFLHARTDPTFKYHEGIPLEYSGVPQQYGPWSTVHALKGYEQPIIMDEPKLMTVGPVVDEYEDEIEEEEDGDSFEEEDHGSNDRYVPPSHSKRKIPKKTNRMENKKRETFPKPTRTARNHPKPSQNHSPQSNFDFNSNFHQSDVKNYGFIKPIHEDTTYSAQASKVNNQYFKMNPTSVDPSYYTTLPDEKEIDKMTGKEDEIYSGLLTNKFPKEVKAKARIIKTLNSNRSKKMITVKN